MCTYQTLCNFDAHRSLCISFYHHKLPHIMYMGRDYHVNFLLAHEHDIFLLRLKSRWWTRQKRMMFMTTITAIPMLPTVQNIKGMLARFTTSQRVIQASRTMRKRRKVPKAKNQFKIHITSHFKSIQINRYDN